MQKADQAAAEKEANDEYESLLNDYADWTAQTQQKLGIDSFKREAHLEYLEIMETEIQSLEKSYSKDLNEKLEALKELQTGKQSAAEKAEEEAKIEYQKLQNELNQQISPENLEALKAEYEKTFAEKNAWQPAHR